MSRGFLLLLLAALVLSGRPVAQAQGPSETGAEGQTGTPVTPAARLSLTLRGLNPAGVLRLGLAGAELEDQAVSAEGSAQLELEFGRTYRLTWGDPERLQGFKFYVPRPADISPNVGPIEYTLPSDARSMPNYVWNYPFAPGEKEKIDKAAPPAPSPPIRAQLRPPTRPAPVRAPAPSPRVDELESRVQQLQASLAEVQEENERARRLAEFLGGSALFLALCGLCAGLVFYTSTWNPHRAAMARALERSLPDALRSQSQEVAGLASRLDAVRKQWDHDRDALRRGQELLAAHAARPGELTREEALQLRREMEELRRQLQHRMATAPGEGIGPQM